MKAQINGILHEDSLPFYDQVTPPSAPSRQGSASLPPQLPGHTTTSPRLRMSQHGTAPTRLSTQGSQLDLGDLGVSSPTGQMSRANSKDTGHIATLPPTQYASGSWQGRLSRVSVDTQQPQSARQHTQTHLAPAQRASAPQGSAYASLESMLSSIPETLSSMPSMPSMPSVPSMSDIEKSMQSGWSSFTGSLGLSPPPPLSAQPQQQPGAPAGWVAFADNSSTLPASSTSAEAAVRGLPSTCQPAQPSSTASPQQEGMLLPPGNSSWVAPSSVSVSVRAADGNGGSAGGHTPLASPRKKLTGLQALDPLAAAKEAASVPLRAMSSLKQDPSEPGGHRENSAVLATQASSHGAKEASIPAVEVCPSSDWSAFAAAAQATDLASMQPLPREVTQTLSADQSTGNRANTDVWAQWSMPKSFQTQPPDASCDTPIANDSVAPAADHHSLLDM